MKNIKLIVKNINDEFLYKNYEFYIPPNKLIMNNYIEEYTLFLINNMHIIVNSLKNKFIYFLKIEKDTLQNEVYSYIHFNIFEKLIHDELTYILIFFIYKHNNVIFNVSLDITFTKEKNIILIKHLLPKDSNIMQNIKNNISKIDDTFKSLPNDIIQIIKKYYKWDSCITDCQFIW